VILDFGFWILDWEYRQILDFGLGIMNEQEFKQRTKQLALRAIKVVQSLPQTDTGRVIGKQVLRSATSVGANYRAACRAKSTPDILHKLAIVEEEADETLYWFELLVEAELVPEIRLKNLMSDTNEIVAMIVASMKTIRTKHRNANLNPK
jgi:four helix bundle protein